MEPNSLEAGLESLCLDDELSRVVATRLGAIPKIFPSQASPLPPLLPPAAARLAPPTTPAVLRRQQKKKNRKDRRRNTDADEAGIQYVRMYTLQSMNSEFGLKLILGLKGRLSSLQ